MKLQVAAYNDDTGTWSEVEETAFIDYEVVSHRFDNPAEVNIILSDPTGSIARKYNAKSASAVGGAVSDNGGVETDETAEANENTTNDMILAPSPATEDDAYYIGLSTTFDSFILHVSRIYTGGNLNITWEYSTGADSWSALSNVIDETDDYEILGENRISWAVPSDWATDSVGGIADLYWVRGRVTTAIAIVIHPKGQQAWVGGVYMGPGKVTIEDPTGTDYFYGRIMKATANTDSRTVTLYCLDWLSQLDEEQITYDMREKLSGNIRESTAHADPDNGTFVGPSYSFGASYYFYDDVMSWANDVYNGMYLLFTNGMAGKKEWGTGPYGGAISAAEGAGDFQAEDYDELWTNAIGGQTCFDNDESWTQDIYFRVYLGHNTPSNFYVHDSISIAKFTVNHKFCDDSGEDSICDVQIYDATGAAWRTVGQIVPYDNARGDIYTLQTFTINATYLDDCVDSNGLAKIRFNVTRGAGTTYLYIAYAKFYVTTETTGYSSAVSIADVENGNRLRVSTDLYGAAATKIWEGIPYCIAQKIYTHIESATGPILGGDTMVTLTCADANVENTSGISTRQYVNKTRLEILSDLARQDKAHFWITLGGVIVTYKSTFNDGAPETLTDTDVNAWTSTFDYTTLTNEATVYGMRIGDNRLSSTYTDTTSEGKYKQTRTKVVSDTGLVSEYDTLARATALVGQYKDVQQILTATIRGNTATAAHAKTLKLGDEVSITSTYLGLSADVYIVQRFAYDSSNNLTTLLLHPRVSAIGLQADERPSFEQVMQANRRGTADRYIAAPETNEVA